MLNKPIGILTDDFPKAFHDLMGSLQDNIVEYSVHRREIKTNDEWYKFFEEAKHLQGWILKGFRVMRYHPTNRSHRRDMDEMLAIAPTRVR